MTGAGTGVHALPDSVVAAITAAVAVVMPEAEGGRYRITSIRPVGWASPPPDERMWSLAGRIDAGALREHFGEGRRG